MKYAIALLILCGILIGISVSKLHQTSGQSSPDYRPAFERWRRALDANPALGDPFWVRPEGGPAEMRSAVGDLLSIGPNLTPLLVEEMRNEKDPLRLYQLVILLNAVSGINLYFGSGEENYFKAMPRFRDKFVQDWDSGKFLDATSALETNWTPSYDPQARKGVAPAQLTQIRRYGVYALPFIIKELEKRDSPELFAAFLIITGESELFAHYLEKPSDFLPEREQKLSYVKAWAGRNESKIDKLGSLPQQLKALTTK
jgi:hypothetical protein